MTSYEETRFEYFLPPTSGTKMPLGSNEEAHKQAHALWQRIEHVLTDTQERRLAYLLFHCALTPNEIMLRCASEFTNIQEVYAQRSTIIKKLLSAV